jgi:hypothetical protein
VEILLLILLLTIIILMKYDFDCSNITTPTNHTTMCVDSL